MSFWDSLVDRLQTLGELIVEWGILIIVALLVLVIGRWIIGLLRTLAEKFLGASFLQPLWNRSGVSSALEGTDQTPARIGGTIVYAYLMVVLFLVVARILRITTIEDLLERLLAWIPLLLVAAIVVLIAAAAGNWAAGLVRPFAEEQRVPWLTAVVHVGIILFGVLFALDLMNIEFAENVILIAFGAAGIAAAVAFGVGGIDAAKKWWAKYGTPEQVGKGGPPQPPTV